MKAATRRKIAESVRRAWQEGRFKITITPEHRQRTRDMALAQRGKTKPKSKAGIESMRRLRQGKPHLAKGPTHHSGRVGVLKSPDGRVWEFKNLTDFVRSHPELFNSEDIREFPDAKKPSTIYCRARCGLSALFKASPNKSWKGWIRIG